MFGRLEWHRREPLGRGGNRGNRQGRGANGTRVDDSWKSLGCASLGHHGAGGGKKLPEFPSFPKSHLMFCVSAGSRPFRHWCEPVK